MPSLADDVARAGTATNRGFHSNGYRSDFYDANGNPTKWMSPLTGKVEDIPAGTTFHKDHVFPKNEIRNLDGFDQLSASQKNQILNDPSNFQPLNGSMNCSKGCTVNGTANQWDTYKGQPVNPEYSKWLQQQQDLSRQSLQAKIDAMLQ
jgi:filamentous hemagglutinin